MTNQKEITQLNTFLRFIPGHEFMAARLNRFYTWLTLAFIYSFHFWPLINTYFIILLCALFLFYTKKYLPATRLKRILLVIFSSLYLASVIGLLYTSNLKEGFMTIQQKLPLISFPVIFAMSGIVTDSFRRLVFIHFVIATILACVISLGWGLMKYANTHDIAEITNQGLMVFPDSYTYITGLSCLTAIIFAVKLIESAGRKYRIIIFSAIAFLSLYIFLLSIRMIIICWVIVAIFLAFRMIKKRIWRLAVYGLLLALIVGGITFIPALNSQWKEIRTRDASNTIKLDEDASLGRGWGGRAIREAIWRSSERMVEDYWVTGVGTGDVQDSLQQAYEERKFYFASRYNRYNAHNQYLQTLIANGILTLMVLVAGILIPFFTTAMKAENYPYLLFLALFAFICLTEVVLDINKGVVWYSFFNSIFAFINPNKEINNVTAYGKQT